MNVGSVILEGVKMSYAKCFTSLIVNKEVSDKLEVRYGPRSDRVAL